MCVYKYTYPWCHDKRQNWISLMHAPTNTHNDRGLMCGWMMPCILRWSQTRWSTSPSPCKGLQCCTSNDQWTQVEPLQNLWICSLMKNKATGWLAALVVVMNLKLRFLRLRDKILVFVGLVKKCLQYGHEFRLAGVWLKCQNLRFACAVNRLFSSGVKKSLKIMIFNHPRQTSTHPFFSSSRSFSARVLLATQRPQTPTRRHYDAMSNCKPKSTFFCTLAGFSCGAWTLVSMFWRVSMYHPCVEYQQQWFYGICPANDLENDKS